MDDPSKPVAPGPAPTPSRRVAGRLGRLALAFLLALLIMRLVGCMEKMFYVPTRGPTPLPAGFEGAERMEFPSLDGTPLVGWFLPAGGDPRAAPSMLHIHGNAGNITDHIDFSGFLPRAGVNLMLFDYRGYGESGGSAWRRDDLIADALAALDALCARPDVDPARVGLFGQSLGGAIGLNVMAERDEVRAAVIISAFSSWRSIAADTVSPRRGDAGPGPVARALAAVSIPDHRAPIDAIARIDRPLLLLHGDVDEMIPLRHARALAAAGPTADLVVLPGAHHNDIHIAAADFEDVILTFIAAHLGPARAPAAEGDRRPPGAPTRGDE